MFVRSIVPFFLCVFCLQVPTVARAIVNRIWQAYFGVGLVQTAEDLGTQGESPSYGRLLDWLAVELMDNGWSLKHIHRFV